MQRDDIDVGIVGLYIRLYGVEQRCAAFFLLSFGQLRVLPPTQLGSCYWPEAIG